MARVDIESGWEAELNRVVDERLLTRICDEIAQDANRHAPVDTGRLSKSYHVTNVAPGVKRVQSGVEYAPDVELGTVNMPAQPHLRPAVYKRRSI